MQKKRYRPEKVVANLCEARPKQMRRKSQNGTRNRTSLRSKLRVVWLAAVLTAPVLAHHADAHAAADGGSDIPLTRSACQGLAIDEDCPSSLERNTGAQVLPWKIALAGYYSIERENFFLASISMVRTTSTTMSFEAEEPEIPILTFQLKDTETEETIREVKQPWVKAQIIMDTFSREHPPKRLPAPTLFIVLFDLPDHTEQRNFRVYVVSEKGNVVFAAPVSAKAGF
ncbi:MAG: hypothetical protein OXP66_19245 [Candidatus Tectomicrobia bacterium]|nr:hypothetical protein [Candidatus Tectomicrobia bacterium]